VAELNRNMLLIGALLAAAGVALGAFGAHGLRDVLDARQLSWWHTAVQYQMWHALALVALSFLPIRRRVILAILLAGGATLFSGSLYLMALTGWRWLGAVTPLGGLAMIAGWLLLAWEARRSPAE
jgi:uncharacterized membrane protein YgdD (TMEM256/DUF423 family)